MQLHQIQLKIDMFDIIYQGRVTIFVGLKEHMPKINEGDYVIFRCAENYVTTKVLVLVDDPYTASNYIGINFKVIDKE